jgi:hypothetical protein
MNQLDFALKTAETRMNFAIPNPNLWSGSAAGACAESIERLVHDLRALQHRLNAWPI